MDILGPNFPHLLPQWPTVQQMKNAESFPIRGQRGVANDEVTTPDGVVKCDEEFLDSLIDHLGYMDLLVLQAGDLLNVATTYKTYGGNPLNYNRNVHVREALTVVSKVKPEIERLSKHPELFVSEERKAAFLKEAGIIARLSREMLEIDARIAKLQPSLQNEIDNSASQRPADKQSGNRVQPWESFARPLNVENLQKRADWGTIQENVPDVHLHRANILPMSGTLLAERYRQREQFLIDNSKEPSDEERALVHPTAAMLQDIHRSNDHAASVKRPVPVPVQEDQKPNNGLAWGKQERVAEMGRFMALMNDDVTSMPGQVRPPAVFLGTFRSEEGMRLLEEQDAADKKELEGAD
nr:MAT1-1-10 [Cercospora zeina]